MIPTGDGGFDAWSLADATRRHWTPPSGTHLLFPGLFYATADDIALYTNRGARRIDPTMLPVVP